MNLYEIKDVRTGQLLDPAVSMSLQEVADRLHCSKQLVTNSYHGNYAIEDKYKLEQVDVTIKKTDTIWIDWELRRNWFLKLCGK